MEIKIGDTVRIKRRGDEYDGCTATVIELSDAGALVQLTMTIGPGYQSRYAPAELRSPQPTLGDRVRNVIYRYAELRAGDDD